MILSQLHRDKINSYRFRLLALTLSFYFILPPFANLPALEAIKAIVLKLLIILIGGEFMRPGRSKQLWYVIGVLNLIVAGINFVTGENNIGFFLFEYLLFVLMVITLFYLLMKQISQMKEVTSDGIIGAFNGYVLLGLIAFFTYLTISLFETEMFSNLGEGVESIDRLFYYSFISMTTIGFGDIVPTHSYSQKLTIFFGIIGQFYIAVNVAILVSKYMAAKKD